MSRMGRKTLENIFQGIIEKYEEMKPTNLYGLEDETLDDMHMMTCISLVKLSCNGSWMSGIHNYAKRHALNVALIWRIVFVPPR